MIQKRGMAMYDSENQFYGNFEGMNQDGNGSLHSTGFEPVRESTQDTDSVLDSMPMQNNNAPVEDSVPMQNNSVPVQQTVSVQESVQAQQTFRTQEAGFGREPEYTRRAGNGQYFDNLSNTAGQATTYAGQTAARTEQTTTYAGQTAAHATQASSSAAQTTTYTEQSQAHTGRAARHTKSKNTTDRKKGHTFGKVMLSLSLGLLFGIFAGVGFVGVTQIYNTTQKSTPAMTTESNVIPQLEESEEKNSASSVVQEADSPQVIYTTAPTNVTSIVKNVMPAMVSITNNYTEVTTFWGQTYKEELSASGSGIIVARTDEELLIVSNQHVVADADQLLVTLDDGTEVEAKIKGTDKEMDLAVISIKIDDLSTDTLNAISVARLGDSDDLELGEQVIAIGNALGYGQSVTVGYISALDREIELEDGSLRSFIQTDAAINPGNSGGALLNAAGEVIGINSNKIGGTSIEGMGYAIPITAASPIIADLMERQTRDKVADGKGGYMGISYQEVTDDIANMFGMPKGVYVATVYEDSGAEKAGIMKGDVITKFDGQSISSFDDLQDILQYFAVGDTANVTVMRPVNGEYVEYNLQITLGERPSRNRN